MALLLHRRAFLGAAAGAGFAMRLHAAQAAPARWALLSDTHCPEDPKDAYRGFLPYEQTRTIAARAAASGAGICAISGDLARLTGKPGDYEALRGLLRPLTDKMPVCFGLGNHDHRVNFQNAFASGAGVKQSVARKHVVTLEWTDWRAVMLDSLLETNVTPGQLGSAQRQWLARYIASDPRPALLFVHHDFGEGDGALMDAPKFLASIAPLKQVKAVFYGHSHEYKFGVHEGVHLVNLPAVGYNFRDSEPVGWVEMTLSAKGASLLLHASGGNTERDGKSVALDWR
jgi:3',5'-cyclic AMP phosphodiesterase CpdA